jgi:hypothetical protein
LGTHYGTTQELEECQGNMLGTDWEHRRKKQTITPPPTPPPKGKNRAHNECMLSLPVGCMKFLFPKLFVTIKNDDKTVMENKKFHAANEKAQHALMRGPVFFLGAEREGGFFPPCSLCALIMFSYGSHQVPQVLKLFLKTFQIEPQIYLI